LRRVLIVLAIILALYLGATALGMSQSDDPKGGDPDAIASGWVSSLDSLSAWFAPKLDLEPLRCNGQPVASVFKLTEAAETCTLPIARDTDEDYRHAELRLVRIDGGTPPGIYVRAQFDESRFPKKDRDPSSCFLTDPPNDPFRLQVEYTPRGDPPEDGWECWLRRDPGKSISVTVLAEGGSLRLTCVGCSAQSRRELVLRMR